MFLLENFLVELKNDWNTARQTCSTLKRIRAYGVSTYLPYSEGGGAIY